MRSYIQFKDQAIALRKSGKTYTEIQELLNVTIPPSTLCTWFQKILFSEEENALIARRGNERIRAGVIKAAATKTLKRQKRDEELFHRNLYLRDFLDDKNVAKLGLVMLYLCEGSKHQGGCLCFGNSNAGIIQLFLRLLRSCYVLEERKLHATVQCRADQDGDELTSYWSAITHIDPDQFYRPRIDKRTIGFPTKKPDYKGVCRIEYFSAKIYNEVRVIGNLL